MSIRGMLWRSLVGLMVVCSGVMATNMLMRVGADVKNVAETKELYFAQLADGGGYVTQIVLANPGETDISATLELFRSAGTPLAVTINNSTNSTFTFTIKARGSLFLKTSGTGTQVTAGWARVKSNGPLGGSLVYSNLSGVKAVSEAGLDPSSPATQFCFTVDTRQSYFSGLAVVNPNNAALEVRYALYDTEGNLKGQSNLQLGAMQHAAKMMEELFPSVNLKDFTGTVAAFSNGGSLVATTLRFDAAVDTLASIPVVTGLAIAPIPSSGGLAPGALYAVDTVLGNLRFVPAGTFLQGTALTEACNEKFEQPQFRHTLSRNLAVMETEVTRQMWADLRGAQPGLVEDPTCILIGSGMSYPVQCLSWNKTVLFANLLSRQRGLTPAYYKNSEYTQLVDATNYTTEPIYCRFQADGYRLPTEGEWEYFTRAGTTEPFSITEPFYDPNRCQDCIPRLLMALENVGWFCSNGAGSSHPVGQKQANPWGLKDVHGNVWEWCWDWWADRYTDSSQIDYQGPSSGPVRVIRGGCWNSYAKHLRSGTRPMYIPSYHSDVVGFRLVRSVN